MNNEDQIMYKFSPIYGAKRIHDINIMSATCLDAGIGRDHQSVFPSHNIVKLLANTTRLSPIHLKWPILHPKPPAALDQQGIAREVSVSFFGTHHATTDK